MYSINSNRSRAAWARGMIVLGAALGLGLMARPAAAAPFAYVANNADGVNTVSVIDAATNMVVATVTVGRNPLAVAVTPDGKHAYVTNAKGSSVSVIDTATNTVLTGTGFPIPVGSGPLGVAITPDGKHAYVANSNDNTVSVIDTATNTVLTGTRFPIPVGSVPVAVAVTPDGKHALS